jgi:hypothetical protein
MNAWEAIERSFDALFAAFSGSSELQTKARFAALTLAQ